MKKLLCLMSTIIITSFASPTFANPMCSQQWGGESILTNSSQIEQKNSGSQNPGQGINEKKSRRSSRNTPRKR